MSVFLCALWAGGEKQSFWQLNCRKTQVLCQKFGPSPAKGWLASLYLTLWPKEWVFILSVPSLNVPRMTQQFKTWCWCDFKMQLYYSLPACGSIKIAEIFTFLACDMFTSAGLNCCCYSSFWGMAQVEPQLHVWTGWCCGSAAGGYWFGLVLGALHQWNSLSLIFFRQDEISTELVPSTVKQQHFDHDQYVHEKLWVFCELCSKLKKGIWV